MRSTLLHMPAVVKRELCSEEVHADRRDMVLCNMTHFMQEQSNNMDHVNRHI